MEETAIEGLLRFIEVFGEPGVMAIFLYLFATGKIISRQTMDTVIVEVSARIVSSIEALLSDKIDELKYDLNKGKREPPW